MAYVSRDARPPAPPNTGNITTMQLLLRKAKSAPKVIRSIPIRLRSRFRLPYRRLLVIHRRLMLFWAWLVSLSCSSVMFWISPLRAVVDGDDPNQFSRHFAIYVTYDQNGIVADFVLVQLRALFETGYRVVFVSCSPRLPPEEIAKVAPWCWKLVHRRNIGHDFGGYRTGIGQIPDLTRAESLILMNDSCYGPLFDLTAIESRAEQSGCDMWGITDSGWTRYHIQSYFIRFNNRALNAPRFRRFWGTLLPWQTRDLVIQTGEIRLTQRMLRDGLTIGVYCPYERVARAALPIVRARIDGAVAAGNTTETIWLRNVADEICHGTQLNATHFFWDVLLEEFGCPFVKRQLLRSNPARVPGVARWKSVISSISDYDVGLIESHLKMS
jgi:Rhamnan synthesis protein F